MHLGDLAGLEVGDLDLAAETSTWCREAFTVTLNCVPLTTAAR